MKLIFVALAAFIAAGTVYAAHSWGGYHWARQSNPFVLNLGDNVSTAWDAYLREASSDWSASTVLDTTVVSGNAAPRQCRATNGRVEICNAKYGFNGWLGVASIWASGSHITQGTVKVNDSYFNTATYNKPEWRRFVMCQEIGHTFGLAHQDENFSNPNIGTCMDYTSNPTGPPSNEHPNAHDYEQLEIIYAHLTDTITTVGQAASSNGKGSVEDEAGWGKELQKDSKGRTSLYVQELEKGDKVFTFVLWAN